MQVHERAKKQRRGNPAHGDLPNVLAFGEPDQGRQGEIKLLFNAQRPCVGEPDILPGVVAEPDVLRERCIYPPGHRFSVHVRKMQTRPAPEWERGTNDDVDG